MNPLPVDIAFVQTDSDTFRSTENVSTIPLSAYFRYNPHPDATFHRRKSEAFFAFLDREGIDSDAYTRPRDVPAGDPPWYNAQAAYVDGAGRMVIDVSVLRKLKEKNYEVPVTYLPTARKHWVSNDSTEEYVPQ